MDLEGPAGHICLKRQAKYTPTFRVCIWQNIDYQQIIQYSSNLGLKIIYVNKRIVLSDPSPTTLEGVFSSFLRSRQCAPIWLMGYGINRDGQPIRQYPSKDLAHYCQEKGIA